MTALALIIWVLLMIWGAHYNASKGHARWAGAVLAGVFGLLGILIIAIRRPKVEVAS